MPADHQSASTHAAALPTPRHLGLPLPCLLLQLALHLALPLLAPPLLISCLLGQPRLLSFPLLLPNLQPGNEARNFSYR